MDTSLLHMHAGVFSGGWDVTVCGLSKLGTYKFAIRFEAVNCEDCLERHANQDGPDDDSVDYEQAAINSEGLR